MTDGALAADDAAPLAPRLEQKGWLRLTPINQRRLANFRANRQPAGPLVLLDLSGALLPDARRRVHRQ